MFKLMIYRKVSIVGTPSLFKGGMKSPIHCPLFLNLNKIDPQIFKFNLSNLTSTLLFESQPL